MVEFPFTGTGKIVYDPPRPVDLKRGTDWWAIIDVNGGREITRYYRWWVDRKLFNPLGFDKKKDAQKCGFNKIDFPSFDAHISIIRGWKDVRHTDTGLVKKLWKKYDGKLVSFKYGPAVRQGGVSDELACFWLVDVDCPIINEIRGELGLITTFIHHLTIGRTW